MKISLSVCAAAALVGSTTALPLHQTVFSDDVLVAPSPFSALAHRLTSPLTSLLTPRLVQTAADEEAYWTTELGKHLLFFRGQRFIDLTDTPDLGSLSAQRIGALAEAKFPEKLQYKHQLKSAVFKEIGEEGPRDTVKTFSSFYNRYYKSETGRQSQKWLFGRVKEIVGEHAKSDGITVREFEHSWGQNSIILHVSGSNHTRSKDEGVTIISAHQDSTHLLPFLRAPGSDDDASGTASILEALRGLLASGWKPETDVEWHWYSAEEGGLLGSQAVAQSYERDGRKVKAQIQQDMVSFVKAGTKEVVGLVSDYTNAPLTAFVKRLVEEYLDIPPVETKIGYAASDHASWSKIGAPAAFAIESTFEDSNKNIHSTGDMWDIPEYSFSHLLQFVRLSCAFAVELGGWTK